MHFRSRLFSIALAFILPLLALAQPKAQPCFFSEDFEGDEIPAGWDIGPWVERTTEDGEPLGEEVPAWRIGNAAQANAGGFFQVPDMPIGNRFIMANDDAPPCPCDMAEVRLITPEFDFTGRTNVALEFRVYHDMGFGGGEAHVEASPNGTDWYLLHTIPAMEGEWQHQLVNMSGWNDPSVWIRFRWSDNGQWATGIAIDDVCLRERFENDLSVLQVFTHDPTVSPFVPGDQSLRYRLLPLEQAGPFTVGAEVMNRGTEMMQNVIVHALIALDGIEQGTFTTDSGEDLLPGERRTLIVATGWTPPTTGELTVTATVEASTSDDDPSDNTGIATMRITGPGWNDGYSAMALDDGEYQAAIGSPGIFITGCRFELVNTGTPLGISAVVSPVTDVGSEIRAVLFDANFAVLDTSVRYTITEEDIALAWGGEAIYLPLSAPVERPAGDLFAGIQRVSGVGEILIGVSGNAALGSTFFMEGLTFDLSYPEVIPMVRLHFSEVAVGLAENTPFPGLEMSVFPNPVIGQARVMIDLPAPASIRIDLVDMLGRTVEQGTAYQASAGLFTQVIDMSVVPPGMYSVMIMVDERPHVLKVIVAG